MNQLSKIFSPFVPDPAKFTTRNLSVLNYANGFTQWHYRFAGSLDELTQPGFFDAADDLIKPGDAVMCSAADGGALGFFAKSPRPVLVFCERAQYAKANAS